MNLTEALAHKKKEVLDLWIGRTLDSYVSPGFFKKSKDQFANPVGVNIANGLTALYELLQNNAEPEAYLKPLDQVVRIRAVQEFTPSQAMSPFLELKWVVKQVFSGDKEMQSLLPMLDTFDCEIDKIALAAFDIYTDCKEQVYRNRIRELKSGSYILTDSGCPSTLLRKERISDCKPT